MEQLIRIDVSNGRTLSGASSDGIRSIVKALSTLCLFLFLNSPITTGQGSLHAEFFTGKNFEKYISSKSMDNIDLYWETESPVSGMDPEKCSIRWTGSVKPPVTGHYKFSARVDYGLRLWIDDILVIDDWALHNWGRLDGRIELEAGQKYNIKVEYFNAMFGGEIRLMWNLPLLENRISTNSISNDAAVIETRYFFEAVPKKSTDANLENVVADASNTIPVSNRTITRSKPKAKKVDIVKEDVVVANEKIEIVHKKEGPKAIAKNKMNNGVIENYKPSSVQFDRAKDEILASSFDELDILAEFLILNQYLHAEIQGHTDLAGDADKNLELSERRAYAVARYLVKKGVGPSQLEAKGYGGTKPLIQTSTKTYHPENRRVSFVISVVD